jgi:hypothetical protein
MEDNKVESKEAQQEVSIPKTIGIPPKPILKKEKKSKVVNPISVIMLLVIVGGVYYLVKNKK